MNLGTFMAATAVNRWKKKAFLRGNVKKSHDFDFYVLIRK